MTTTSTTNYGTSLHPYASASLYVGDLAPEVTENTLFELFNAVGPVASIRVCRDATTKKSLGYAYVNFHNVADADRALDTMNFTNIKGKQCRIMWSQRDPSIRKSGKGNVFVKNLHPNIDNKTLYDTFSVFGSILSCKIATKPDGESRGYGYVHYAKPEDAQKAIEGVNGMLIQDKKVMAELFKSREEREKSFPFTNIYVKYIPDKMTEDKLYELVRKTLTDDPHHATLITNAKFWIHPYGKCACINLETHEYAKKAVELLNGYDLSHWLSDDKKTDKTDKSNEKLNTQEKNEENKDNENKEDDLTTEQKTNVNGTTTQKEKKTKLYVAKAQKKRDRLIKLGRYRSVGKPYNVGSKYFGINLYIKNLHQDIDDDKLRDMFREFGNILSAKVMKDQTGKSRGFGFVSFSRKDEATKAMFKMNSQVYLDKQLYVSKAQKKEQRKQYLEKQRQQQQMYGYGGPMNYPNFPQQRMPYNPNQPFPPQQFAPTPFGPQSMHPMFPRQPPMQFRPPNNPYGPFPIQNQPNPNLIGVTPFAPQQQRFGPGTFNVPFPMGQPQMSQQQQQQSQQQSSGMNLNQSVSRHQLSGSIQQNIQTSVPRTNQPFPTQHIVTGQTSQQVSSQPVQVSTSQLQQTSNPIMVNPQQQSGSQLNQPQQSVTSQLSAPMREQKPLTSLMLANADPAEKKRLIGERLFPKIQEVEPRLAGKITGMLLEMDNTELLVLLDKKDELVKKINEALGVLRDHRLRQSQKNEQPDSAAQRTSTGNQGSTRNQSSTNNPNLSNKNQG